MEFLTSSALNEASAAFRHLEIDQSASSRLAEPHEPVIGAALLVATAFRLRDERGLITALRALVDAVDRFEKAAKPAC
ncbi:MAG: hypothetical protein ACFB3T_12265 [Geminicoccaceae bacterium]